MTTTMTSKKNSTLIGSSMLGTWSTEVTMKANHDHDSLTAYMMVHFMADPRKSHGCVLDRGCEEIDNQVCMLTSNDDGSHYKPTCHDMGNETDVSWSDLNAFLYFGVKIHSDSTQPKTPKLELSTGDWIGPFNIIMAPTTTTVGNTTTTRYVARYVQSQSVTPVYFQNKVPPQMTLYTKSDDYASLLGHPVLESMTRRQTNLSIEDDTTNTTNNPYEPYRDNNCANGDLQAILPLIELDGVNNTLQLQYKILAVPTPDEQAYRILPQLQSKFQGHHYYNIVGGPYCYGKDPVRAYSFDLNVNSSGTLKRGCLEGYPCLPEAAMGGPPIVYNATCPTPPPPPPDKNLNISNTVLAIVCYALTVFLMISLTVHCQVMDVNNKKKKKRRQQLMMLGGGEDDAEMQQALMESAATPETLLDDSKPSYFGIMNLLGGGATRSHQNEEVGPFGDLVDAETEEAKEDPLKEPLLPQGEQQDNGNVEEAAKETTTTVEE